MSGWRVERATGDAGPIAASILHDLPGWFGRPDALAGYVAAATCLPTLVARGGDGAVAGFLTVERPGRRSAELHVMGVRRNRHGAGCGRALVAAAERWLVGEGVRWLAVSTLAASHPDPCYAQTRGFYDACGFRPLEVFADLWGSDTPCLLMAKRIG